MWLEGYSIPQNVEASDYTKEFFAKPKSDRTKLFLSQIL